MHRLFVAAAVLAACSDPPPRDIALATTAAELGGVEVTREPITGDVFHYSFTLRVGDGPNARVRLLVVDIAHPGPAREVPGNFIDEAVCGWSTTGDILVRTRSPPIHIRRVGPTTGTSTPVIDIAPPRLGLRGVDAVVIDPAGDAYAYSYGQELSRLYTMTTEPL